MREKGIANNIIGSIIDYYRNMKIRNRLLLLLFSTVLLVCLISLLLLNFVIYKYNNLLYNEASQVLNLSTAGIENAIKKVEDISFNILADSRIQEHAIEIQNSENAYDRFRELRTLSERIMAFISNESKIISAVFIDGQGNEAVSGNYPRSLNEDTKKHVLAKAAEEKGGFTIIDPSVDDISLIYARQIRSVKDLLLEPLGTLIFRVEFKQLVQKNLNISSQYDLNLLIYYKDQNIYPPDKTDIVSLEDFNFKNNSGYEITNIAGKKHFIAYTKSKYTGFTYINIILYEDIFAMIMVTRNIVLIVLLSLISAAVFVSFRFANGITRPIEKLSAKMKLIEKGNFEILDNEAIEYKNVDEVSKLHNDFHMMVGMINTLIKEHHVKEIVVRDAQYKALQAQINPHFLYNTLESINWMAKINEQTNISQMVESLGYLLRSSISKKEHIISIKEEMEILKNYITIQKIRYEERLIFDIEIDDEYLDYQIPKLTFQPIVENSINYGLENMIETCHIKLIGKSTQDTIQFIITDNGPGVQKGLLDLLRAGEIKPKGKGIGLQNIDDRIKMVFGEKYGLKIDSSLDGGTMVIINIPREGEAEYV